MVFCSIWGYIFTSQAVFCEPLGEQNTTRRVKINTHNRKQFNKVFIKWVLMKKVISERKPEATGKSYACSLMASQFVEINSRRSGISAFGCNRFSESFNDQKTIPLFSFGSRRKT